MWSNENIFKRKLMLIFVILVTFINIWIINAEELKYETEITKCLNATSSHAKEITNYEVGWYECIFSWGENKWSAKSKADSAFQVVLDLALKEVDKEIETEIRWLKDNALNNNLEKVALYSELFQETSLTSKYYLKYSKACKDIEIEVNAYFKSKWKDSIGSDWFRSSFIEWWACMTLAIRNLNIYKAEARNIMRRDASDTNIAQKDNFIHNFRKEFTRILNLALIYVTTLMELVDKVDYILPVTRWWYE